MDHASMGRPMQATVEAVRRSLRRLEEHKRPGTELTLGLMREVEEAKKALARLLTVSPENVALVENTTQGLGLLATSVPLKPGDNVVVPDIEFLSAVLVWRRVEEIIGIEIRPARTRGGQVRIEDLRRVMDRRTRIVVMSAVQEVSGDRVDLDSLGELADTYGAYLVVDGIQEVGALRRNLSEAPIHAYCAGGHKWLGSPFGLGFMYVHPTLLEVCQPAFYGYFNLIEPKHGWDMYLQSRERSAFDKLEMIGGAARLESGGMPNWLGAVGLRHAIENILRWEPQNIEDHVLWLNRLLRDGLSQLRLESCVLGRQEPEHWSAIVTFGLPGGLRQERRLLKKLERENVFVSLRSVAGIGGIRASPYVENTPDDVEILLNIVEGHLKEV